MFRHMTDPDLTRRAFLRQSAATVGPAVAAGLLPLSTARAEPAATQLSVVCIGGHPDDPESGCGGTLARYAAAGHVVTIVYLTRGERGIAGKSLDEAARIRTAESDAACKILGATPRFFGQIDGATELTHAHVDTMTKLVAALKPDVILAHWPIDTHMDHQVASLLAIRAWMSLKGADLFFYEVNAGSQTEGFKPDAYVDISAVVEQKKRALFGHVSQDGEGIWREHHEIMAAWRGREIGIAAAEGFVHHARGGRGLPGAEMKG
jgi:LmbE family N-acetylglucosaminyl deacetylase